MTAKIRKKVRANVAISSSPYRKLVLASHRLGKFSEMFLLWWRLNLYELEIKSLLNTQLYIQLVASDSYNFHSATAKKLLKQKNL